MASTSDDPPRYSQRYGQNRSKKSSRDGPVFEKVSWYREPHLRRLYACICILMATSANVGYDAMLVNISQQLDRWKEFFPRIQASVNNSQEVADSWLGLMINSFNIGSVISYFIAPHVADTWGRKKTLICGALVMITGAGVAGLCNGYASRFILGFGTSLSNMASPLLLTELCHPQHRGPVTSVYNCLWNLGALFVAWGGWGTAQIQNDWSWRSITLFQASFPIVQLAAIYWIPESPRYLISKKRYAEAFNILAEYHGGGDIYNKTVHFEFREIKATLRLEKAAKRASGYLELFRTKGYRWRLAILVSLGVISQYSGNALFSNYIDIVYEGAGITDQNRKLVLSGGKTILDLIVTVLAASNVDRFGRRPLFLVAMCGMVGSFAVWTLLAAIYGNSNFTNSAAGYAQLLFIWIFGIFYDIGFSGLLVAYALEILPYHIRAKGIMILNISIQSFLALGNQTNKLAWNSMPNYWNFMLFYTIWNAFELVFVYFFYVETKGPTLEEVARVFDGKDAVAHIDMRQVEKELSAAQHRDTIALHKVYINGKPVHMIESQEIGRTDASDVGIVL